MGLPVCPWRWDPAGRLCGCETLQWPSVPFQGIWIVHVHSKYSSLVRHFRFLAADTSSGAAASASTLDHVFHEGRCELAGTTARDREDMTVCAPLFHHVQWFSHVGSLQAVST